MFIEKGLEQRFRAFFQFFDNFCNGALATVKHAVGTLKERNAFWRKFISMQAERMEIQGRKANRVPERTAAWRHVVIDLERATHKSVSPHLVPLLYRRRATKSRVLADTNVTAHLASIRDDRPVATWAVVAPVSVSPADTKYPLFT